MKLTNRQVIEANIQMFRAPVEKWERKKAVKKLTAREEKAYKRDLRRLERQQEKLKTLDRLGGDLHTKTHPFG